MHLKYAEMLAIVVLEKINSALLTCTALQDVNILETQSLWNDG